MIIVGISGKKRSGKDTVCQMLITRVGDKYAKRIAFADALKEELASAMGVDVKFINDNKDALRGLLQSWGTNFRRDLCDKDYWIRKTLRKMLDLPPHIKFVFITDVRFESEADCLLRVGGSMIRINSPRSPQDTHPSETDLDNYGAFSYTIDNNGTLEQLEQQTLELLNYISKHAIHPH